MSFLLSLMTVKSMIRVNANSLRSYNYRINTVSHAVPYNRYIKSPHFINQ